MRTLKEEKGGYQYKTSDLLRQNINMELKKPLT
jgi:hypothetical protein